MNDNMKHFNFQCKFGLNILEDKLNTDSRMLVGPGGFYYCNMNNVGPLVYYGDFLCIVEIPDDAVVVNLEKYYVPCFRTDKLILKEEIYRFDNDEDVKYLISIDPNIKGYLNDPQFIRGCRTIIQ